MSSTIFAWEIKARDHIILDGRHYIVLGKNLSPIEGGNEIGVCINCMEPGCRERSWKVFRWNNQITRIN